jgi:hypothetical protein
MFDAERRGRHDLRAAKLLRFPNEVWEREKTITTRIAYNKGLKPSVTLIQSFLIYNPCRYIFFFEILSYIQSLYSDIPLFLYYSLSDKYFGRSPSFSLVLPN